MANLGRFVVIIMNHRKLTHYAVTLLGGGKMLCLVGWVGEKLTFQRKKLGDKNSKRKSGNGRIKGLF